MPPDPIHIHLESEGFKGIFFGPEDENGIRHVKRMVPPHKIRFFYSAGNVMTFNPYEKLFEIP